jgi:hypothetical protein
MAQTRFTCTLTKAYEPACQSYARTQSGAPKEPVSACPRHAVAALDGITGALSAASTGPTPKASTWERKALELAEERSQLRRHQ